MHHRTGETCRPPLDNHLSNLTKQSTRCVFWGEKNRYITTIIRRLVYQLRSSFVDDTFIFTRIIVKLRLSKGDSQWGRRPASNPVPLHRKATCFYVGDFCKCSRRKVNISALARSACINYRDIYVALWSVSSDLATTF